MRKRRRPTELNPCLGLRSPRLPGAAELGPAGGLSAGSAAQARSAALVFLWDQLESLYKGRVCSELMLLAGMLLFQALPCNIIFVLAFFFGMQMSSTSVYKFSLF